MPTVIALWRYPIKSMLGEAIEQVDLGPEGVPGDRGWAVVDVAAGNVVSAKREARLLQIQAHARPGAPAFTMPDGGVFSAGDPAGDTALSDFLGRPVRLEQADGAIRQIENEDPDRTFLSRGGGFFDGGRLHVVTTGTLEHLRTLADADFDARRFRPNIVLDTDGHRPEQTWIGSQIRVGDAVLAVERACHRCVMTTAQQTDLPKDRTILQTVARLVENIVGVYAHTDTPGRVRVGDRVEV